MIMFKGTPISSSPINFNGERSCKDVPVGFPFIPSIDNEFLFQTGDSTRSLLEPIHNMNNKSNANSIDMSYLSNEDKNERISRYYIELFCYLL